MKRYSVYVEKNDYDNVVRKPDFRLTREEYREMPIMQDIHESGDYYKLEFKTQKERNTALEILKRYLKLAIPLNELI